MYSCIHDPGIFPGPIRDMNHIYIRIIIQVILKQLNADLNSFVRLVFLAYPRILQSDVERSRKHQIFSLFTQCGSRLCHILVVPGLSFSDLRHR